MEPQKSKGKDAGTAGNKPNILKGVRKVKKKMDETYNHPTDINVWKKTGMFDYKEE